MLRRFSWGRRAGCSTTADLRVVVWRERLRDVHWTRCQRAAGITASCSRAICIRRIRRAGTGVSCVRSVRSVSGPWTAIARVGRVGTIGRTRSGSARVVWAGSTRRTGPAGASVVRVSRAGISCASGIAQIRICYTGIAGTSCGSIAGCRTCRASASSSRVASSSPSVRDARVLRS